MKPPYNVWLYVFKGDFWVPEIISHFKSLGYWKHVIYHQDKREWKVALTGNGETVSKFYKYVPEEIYDNVYEHFNVFCNMYGRIAKNNTTTYGEKNFYEFYNDFNLYLNYFFKVFTTNNIDLVVFSRAPHMGHDYLAYLVAKKLGIHTLLLEQSHFPDKFFYSWDQQDFGDFNTANVEFDHDPIQIENSFEKDLIYMKSINQSFSLSDLFNTNQLYKKIPEYRMFRELFDRELRGQAIYRYELYKKFQKKQSSLSNNADLEQPFVYFPLHLQPEKTTSAWGGKYVDQILAIEHLSTILPKDWKIYVKENPKQNYFMRDHGFYERLSRIQNVQLLSEKINTYQLLKHCKLVATITGTVGWEAITGGKHAITFGSGIWYKTLPGVHSFDPNLDLEAIFSEKISFEEVQNKLNQILRKTGNGVIYNGWYLNLVEDFDERKNTQKVLHSLDRILKANLPE